MDPSPADDERTVLRPAAARAGRLGHILPVGTRLRDFDITGLIGEGGFGIVYLAYDRSLERRVALKEYMPSSMAARVAGGPTVAVKSERHQEAFDAGLRSFVNEARLLARFDHPSLVKVYRFWEEHGTAYMVMPYYEGPTLRAALAARSAPPDEATLRAWLRPLLDALEVMHASHCYHRDIAPDNILLTQTGPLLLDFGAARRVIGDMTHALTVVLKPGYAPIEQYGEVAAMTQGAWTDIYALASVVHFAVTGRVPPSSVERLLDDRLERLTACAAGRYSPRFLAAIDAALAVRPEDRPQTDAEFRALLDEPRSTLGLPGGAFGPVSRPVPLDEEAPRPPSFEDVAPRPARSAEKPGGHAGGRHDRSARAPDGAPSASARASLHESSGDVTIIAAGAPAAPVPARMRKVVPLAIAGSALVLIAAGAYFLHDLQAPAADARQSSATAAAPTSVTPQAALTRDAPPSQPTATAIVAPPALTRAEPASAEPTSAAPASTVTNATPQLPAITEIPPAPAVAPLSAAPRAVPTTTVPAVSDEATKSHDAQTRGAAPIETSPPAPRANAPAKVARPPRSAEPGPRLAAQERPRADAARPTSSDDGAASRCGDILQKASLEPLSAAEVAYLKRECR